MNFRFFLFSLCMWVSHAQLKRKLPRLQAPVGNSLPFSPQTPPKVFLTILQDNVEMSTPHNLGEIKRHHHPTPPLQALVVRGNSERVTGGLLARGSKLSAPRGWILQGWIKGSGRWQQPDSANL